MRILVDMQSIQAGSSKGGIGRYSLNLLPYLIKNNKNFDFYILLNANLSMHHYEDLLKLLPEDKIYKFYPYKKTQEKDKENKTRSEISQLIREMVISILNPDLVFVTSLIEGYLDDVVVSIGKIFPSSKSSVILYDLIPMTQQEKYLSNPLAKEHYFDKVNQLSSAALILSISEYSKKEGIEFLDVENKLINISSGVDEKFRKIPISSEQKTSLVQKYNLKENIILYVSSYDVRKNQNNLIKAFAKLPSKIKDNYQLVLVGNGAKNVIDSLKTLAKSLSLKEDDINFLGFVNDEDLLKIYSISSLFVFPSLQEGFGLPALEAMRCDIPTIGSHSTSITEVIKKDEALFNPQDIDEIADKINKALVDENFKQELLANAKEQSKKFSWDITSNIAIEAFSKYQNNLDSKTLYCDNFINSYNLFLKKLTSLDELKNYSQEQLLDLSSLIEKNIRIYKRKIGVISTWNTRCGIASYTKYLTQSFFSQSVILAPKVSKQNLTTEDEENVFRSWNLSNDNLEYLYNTIVSLQLEVVFIQFNYGFFNFHKLNSFLDKLFELDIKVSITFHSTTDIIKDKDKKLEILKHRLAKCKNIFIHTQKDIKNLSKIGVEKNVVLLRQGIVDIKDDLLLKQKNTKFTLATYGFFLESKGFLNMIEAFNILKKEGLDISLKMYNAKYNDAASNHLINEAKEKIAKYGLEESILLDTSYTSDEETVKQLSKVDLVVYPYLSTGESSSAAVRMAIASKSLIAVTPQPIFEELKEFVFTFKGDSIEDIAQGLKETIEKIKNNDDEIKTIKQNLLNFRESNLYSKLSNNIKRLL